MTVYAIGDIHGQRAMLAAAHARIEADRARHRVDPLAPVVHLGDLTDRGPDSRGVLDDLIGGLRAGRPWIVLKGNHDRMFHRFATTGERFDPRIRSGLGWLDAPLGGMATLASYGIKADPADPDAAFAAARAAVPQAHLEFLASRPLWHEAEGCLFVHAGIRPGLALADQAEDDLLWIRQGFLDDPRRHPWLVVHGHTALEAPRHFGNRVDLDSGAGYGRPLTAAVFEGRSAFVLTGAGRVPLTS